MDDIKEFSISLLNICSTLYWVIKSVGSLATLTSSLSTTERLSALASVTSSSITGSTVGLGALASFAWKLDKKWTKRAWRSCFRTSFWCCDYELDMFPMTRSLNPILNYLAIAIVMDMLYQSPLSSGIAQLLVFWLCIWERKLLNNSIQIQWLEIQEFRELWRIIVSDKRIT